MKKFILLYVIFSSLGCQLFQKNREEKYRPTSFGVYQKGPKHILIVGTQHFAPREYYYRLISKLDGTMRRLRNSPNEVVVLREGYQDSRNNKFIFPAQSWKSECVASIRRALRGGWQIFSSELGWLYTLGCVSIEKRSSSQFCFAAEIGKRIRLPTTWSRQDAILDPYLERFTNFASDSDLEKEVLTAQLAFDLYENCWTERLPQAPGLEMRKMDSEAVEFCKELAGKVLFEVRESRLFDAIHERFEAPRRLDPKPKVAVIPWGDAHYNSIEKWILSQGYTMKSKTDVVLGLD